MLEQAGAQRLPSLVVLTPEMPDRQIVELPSDPQAARAARGAVSAALEAWGIDGDVVEDARLVASELVGNATVHGCGEVRMTTGLTQSGAGRAVRVEVFDERPVTPALLRAITGSGEVTGEDGLPECGRGLALVRAIADGRVTLVSAGQKGKAVCVELELPVEKEP